MVVLEAGNLFADGFPVHWFRMPGQHDIDQVLSRSRSSWQTLTATVVSWQDRTRTPIPYNSSGFRSARYGDVLEASGFRSQTVRASGTKDLPAGWGVTRLAWKLWLMHPNRARIEAPRGTETRTTVYRHDQVWRWSSSEPHPKTDTLRRFPMPVMAGPYQLVGTLRFSTVEAATALGRPCYGVRATPKGGGRQPLSAFAELGIGADTYDLQVDASLGILLRTQARRDGVVFKAMTMEGIEVDSPLNDELFRPRSAS